ncbi:MAG TPA: hypothetical protein VFJ06_05095, partial [Halococcus sp.]|nr:hypothetical protein [Halococcus sp.]
MSDESQLPRVTRRQALRYGGGITVGAASALAGCSGLFAESSPSPITNVTIRQGVMTVNLTVNTKADDVYLAPNGTSGGVAPLVEWKDNTTVKVGLLGRPTGPFEGYSALPEGNYTVGIRRGNETVDTRGVTLTANPTLTALRPEPIQNSERGFESTGDLLFTVVNQGNLPTALSAVGITGVPDSRRIRGKPAETVPLAEDSVKRVSQPDIADDLSMVLAPSVETTFATTWGPFHLSDKNYVKYTTDPDGDGYPNLPAPCRTKQWSAALTLRFAHSTLTRPFTYSFSGKTKQPFLSNSYLCTGISTSSEST